MGVSIRPPKGEIAWTGYYNRAGEPVCIITSKPARDFYFLYEVKPDGSLAKLGRAKEPPELERKFHVYERMNGACQK